MSRIGALALEAHGTFGQERRDELENYVKNRKDKTIIRFVRLYNDPIEGVHDLNEWNDLIALLNSI